jgi:lambda repressor-like predicted transcriptional regulator
MNYNLQNFKSNQELIEELLREASLKELSKKLKVSVTTLSRYQNNIASMINAPYRITSDCLKEAIKYREYKRQKIEMSYSKFSKICVFIENSNDNLRSAKILLSKTYLDKHSASLAEISKQTHIAYSTLKSYQAKRIDLADASWKRVQDLAFCKKALDLSDLVSKTLIEKMLKNKQEI